MLKACLVLRVYGLPYTQTLIKPERTLNPGLAVKGLVLGGQNRVKLTQEKRTDPIFRKHPHPQVYSEPLIHACSRAARRNNYPHYRSLTKNVDCVFESYIGLNSGFGYRV